MRIAAAADDDAADGDDDPKITLLCALLKSGERGCFLASFGAVRFLCRFGCPRVISRLLQLSKFFQAQLVQGTRSIFGKLPKPLFAVQK